MGESERGPYKVQYRKLLTKKKVTHRKSSSPKSERDPNLVHRRVN